MNPEGAINGTIESTATIKGVAVTSGTVGPSAYILTQAPCTIDYSSPHILIPLSVSILTGVWVILNIYEKIKK